MEETSCRLSSQGASEDWGVCSAVLLHRGKKFIPLFPYFSFTLRLLIAGRFVSWVEICCHPGKDQTHPQIWLFYPIIPQRVTAQNSLVTLACWACSSDSALNLNSVDPELFSWARRRDSDSRYSCSAPRPACRRSLQMILIVSLRVNQRLGLLWQNTSIMV